MSHAASPLAAFHLIGDRTELEAGAAEPLELRPALFGPYVDLSTLRTDFPVVLADGTGDETWARSLSDVIDGLLGDRAEPGTGGEVLRRQVLAQEQAIRERSSSGTEGSLSEHWIACRRALVDARKDSPDAAEALDAALEAAGDAIGLDGALLGFGRETALRMVTHAWKQSERARSAAVQKRIDRLLQKLSGILEVNDVLSPSARQPDRLRGAMGSGDRGVFDFEAMSRVLRTAPAADALPASRRTRIRSAIDVLSSQRFFDTPSVMVKDRPAAFEFAFSDCSDARQAWNERLPEMAALVKALAIAELEIDNHYDEDRHDTYFQAFDENRLGPRDVELFPSYLVCIEQAGIGEQEQVLRILRDGLPFKFLAQLDDVLGDHDLAGGQLSFGTRGQQLAHMATGLGPVFVLQAAASGLYRMRASIYRGVNFSGPALFSVYRGDSYLESAAATESRVFPSFLFDPGAGADQAARYSLEGNPAPATDWIEHELGFESPDHDYQTAHTAFTPVDFMAQFSEFAGRFACVSRDDWNDEQVPAAEFIGKPRQRRTDKVPYVLLIDPNDRLYRGVVDERLLEAAERCLDAWHDLQELGGINNSHAQAAVAEARATWDEENRPAPAAPEVPAEAAANVAAPATVAAVAVAPPAEEEAPEPSSDDPWIETIRCTTCNECTQINDRMFAYDSEKRAYIKDPDAGTYRELVEAAETCQVAIIHPGKPRNPDEPGLEALLERAAPFL